MFSLLRLPLVYLFGNPLNTCTGVLIIIPISFLSCPNPPLNQCPTNKKLKSVSTESKIEDLDDLPLKIVVSTPSNKTSTGLI